MLDRGAAAISIWKAIVWKTVLRGKGRPPKRRDVSRSCLWEAAEDAADCHIRGALSQEMIGD